MIERRGLPRTKSKSYRQLLGYPLKFRSGFSFVEVLVAVLIVTIVVGGMFTALGAGQFIYQHAWRRMQAINFARVALDRLKSNYNYTNPGLTPDPMAVGSAHTEEEILPLPDRILTGDLLDISNATLSYDVANVTDPAPPGNIICKQVTVTVSWDETGFRDLHD